MCKKAEMVRIALEKARQEFEKMYFGICTIYIKNKTVGEDHITRYEDEIFIEDEPCRLSYKSATATLDNGVIAKVSQSVVLDIKPEIKIPDGCKIKVTQNGFTTIYSKSGEPKMLKTHQVVPLELYKGKA